MPIKQWISIRGYTLAEAAQTLRVPHRTLVGWVCYGRVPSAQRQEVIARLTDGAVMPEDWHLQELAQAPAKGVEP